LIVHFLSSINCHITHSTDIKRDTAHVAHDTHYERDTSALRTILMQNKMFPASPAPLVKEK